MGLYGNYCAVAPAIFEACRDDFASWGQLLDPIGPEGQTFSVDRMWDTLWYVLDPARRGNANLEEPSGLLGTAVVGAHLISEEVSRKHEVDAAGILRRSRYLTPEEVRSAAVALRAVTKADVREVYDPEAMERANVYRAGSLELVTKALRDLRVFYEKAGEGGDVVTVRIW